MCDFRCSKFEIQCDIKIRILHPGLTNRRHYTPTKRRVQRSFNRHYFEFTADTVYHSPAVLQNLPQSRM